MIEKILIFITMAAFLVRFINFRYPPLLWDEAAIGYNAYPFSKPEKMNMAVFSL